MRFIRDKSDIIKKNVNFLKGVGWIREVCQPTWLSNVVVENKTGEEYKMCVNFTDLNTATPKYCFSLPNIDQLVNATTGFETMSFMAIYFIYYQI